MRYQLPLTLRIMFQSVRAVWVAAMITVIAWVALVPASAGERLALGTRVGEDRPRGLVQMRIARAMVHFAPDRAAQMLSRASDGEISPELAGMMLRDLAAGPGAGQITTQDESRSTGGAKFVQVDRP